MKMMSSIVWLGLMGVLASGCVVETVDDGGLDAGASELAPRAGSAALNDALQIVDDMFELMIAAPAPDLPWMLTTLEEMGRSIDYAALNAEERDVLSTHILTEGADEDVQTVMLAMQDLGVPFQEPIPLGVGMCDSYCMVILSFECGSNRFQGLCLGRNDCGDGIGVAECLDPPSNLDCAGEICGEGERCARWLFKPNECVETCDSDADCSGGEECKKPAGTAFKRCK